MLRVFVAVFVVMNVLPLLPVVVNMTAPLEVARRRTLINEAMLIGLAVSVMMILAGPLLLSYIGITLHDLRVGGGIVLLVFVTYDLLFSTQQRKENDRQDTIGPVPLGVPILVGPATLATLLVMTDVHGPLLVLGVFGVNLAFNWVLVQNAHRLVPLLGEPLTMAIGKIYSLFLAAIAVSMIRYGIYGVIESYGSQS